MIEITIQWRHVNRSFLWLAVERNETEIGDFPVYQYVLLLFWILQINFQYTSKKAEDSYVIADNDLDDAANVLDDASRKRIVEALGGRIED